MKNKLLKKVMLPCLFLIGSIVYAQTVSGVVSDASGPIPGVNVLVKGTTTGTQTDFDGNYSVNVNSADAVLVFSFLGYATQEIPVNGQTTINVTLLEDVAALDEVVIIGYGTVKKSDATGAIDAVSSKSFTTIAADSPAQVLRGKTAGVQVTSSSGEPGAGVAIRVRGNTSIRSGNEPLIVVDGVPLAGGNVSAGIEGATTFGSSSSQNPLNFINQNDIESISVLKDASSTAIYGSRGANGVIIITTKKGSRFGEGKPVVSYDVSTSFNSFKENGSYRDVMSKGQFLSPDVIGSSIVTDNGGNYDWTKVILRDAFTHNHNLTISNVSQGTSTRLAIGLSRQEGIVDKTGLDKYTLSFNDSRDLIDGLIRVDSKVIYSRLENQSHLLTTDAGFIGNLIGASLYWRPDTNVFGGSGAATNSGYTYVGNNFLNPKQLLDSYDDNTITSKLLASVSANLRINDKLSFKTLIGIETSRANRGTQLLPTIHVEAVGLNQEDFLLGASGNYKGGGAGLYNDNRLNTSVENTLNYNNTFGDVNIDALIGYSYYKYDADGNRTFAGGFNFNQTDLVNNIEGGTNSEFRANSYKNRSEIDSYFARVQLSYQRFLATATYRNDGSSKLGEGNKRGSFPSLGLGYKVFENEAGIVNDLKVRANWGITGNQEFAVNSALSVAAFGNGAGPNTTNNANPDLKWEITNSYGIGADFTILDSKLNGTIDYFYKSTKDLIFAQPAATTQPAPNSPKFINLDGDLINRGLELGLSYSAINKEDMSLDFSGNVSFISNEMQNFAPFIPAGAINGQGLTGAFAQVLSEGNPLYTYYLFEFRGYDSAGNSLYTQPDGSEGPLGTASKVILDKQALPKTNVGFSTSFRYKQFDVSTSFYGAFGQYIYNNTANGYYVRSVYPGRNITYEAATSGQNGSDPNTPSTKFLEKGDFLRWDNLTVGYNFKSDLLEKIKATSARFYINLNNLAVFTDYTGFDPEVDTNKTLNGVPSAGMDYLSYPRSKGFTLGLNVTF